MRDFNWVAVASIHFSSQSNWYSARKPGGGEGDLTLSLSPLESGGIRAVSYLAQAAIYSCSRAGEATLLAAKPPAPPPPTSEGRR